MNSYLRFTINRQIFSIPLSSIKEVTYYLPVTDVPGTPGVISGVCNHRGDILSVITLSPLFGLADQEANSDSRIIVAIAQNRLFGILADKIEKIITPGSEELKPAMPGLFGSGEEIIKHVITVNEDVIPVLDMDKLIHMDDISRYWKNK